MGNNNIKSVNPFILLIDTALKNKADIAVITELSTKANAFDSQIARKEFFIALSKFQTAIPIVCKSAHNEQTDSKHETIEDIANAIKQFLEPNGLSYRFEFEDKEKILTVACIVTHAGGHEEETEMSAALFETKSQEALYEIAAKSSYLSRYTMRGALGVIVKGEDNDGDQSGITPEPSKDLQEQFYPDDKFDLNLAKWSKIVHDKKKSLEQLVEWLETKGVLLSTDQQESIKNEVVNLIEQSESEA